VGGGGDVGEKYVKERERENNRQQERSERVHNGVESKSEMNTLFY